MITFLAIVESRRLRRAFVANTLDRLVDLIVTQGEEMLRRECISFPSRAVSTVLLLGEGEELSAADIARALDQPHQLVTQRIDLLIELGIVRRVHDKDDSRRKALVLTSKGVRQLEALKGVLARAEAAFAALFKSLGCDLSAEALRVMAALEETPLAERAR